MDAKENASALTFEEFRAINERANPTAERERKAPEKTHEGGEAGDRDGAGTAAGAGGVGDFLEMPQIQAFMVSMILVDVFAAFLLQLLRLDEVGAGGMQPTWLKGVAKTAAAAAAAAATTTASASASAEEESAPFSIVQSIAEYTLVSPAVLGSALTSFTGFTLLLFLLEMLAIIVVFNRSVLGHVGYAIDCVVISFQMYCEVSGNGVQGRLLSILRLWRLMRLVNSLVGIEKDFHEATKSVLADREGVNRQLEGEVRRGEEELDKEREARRAVDEMLASYKEEVETLNEALKIAAMDIAEVAEADDDLLLSDDEEGNLDEAELGAGVDNDDDAGFTDASGSAYDKARNREVLMREARRDAYNPQAAAMRRARETGKSTFHVHEDGSYDQTM